MALSLNDVRVRGSSAPPKILIYGCGGIGKTTLASEFPSPIFLQTEDGIGDLALASFSDGAIGSYADVMAALRALAKEKHDYQTLVVDSATRLEPLVWAHVCAQHKWKSIEQPGYGKGYVEADVAWRQLQTAWNWLSRHKQMSIVLIAHEDIRAFADPTTESYDRYQPRLHKRAEALLREDADAVGFMRQLAVVEKEAAGFGAEKAKARGAGQVALYLRPRPAFVAKCRFKAAPDFVLIEPGKGYAALAPFLTRQPAKETQNG